MSDHKRPAAGMTAGDAIVAAMCVTSACFNTLILTALVGWPGLVTFPLLITAYVVAYKIGRRL